MKNGQNIISIAEFISNDELLDFACFLQPLNT